MIQEEPDRDLQELIGRPVWYQFSRDHRMLLVMGCLILTVVSFSIPVIYFKSVSFLDASEINERYFLFYETNAWVFVVAAVLPMMLLLLKGPQQFGLLLSLLSLGAYLLVFFGFLLFLNQALGDPSILSNMGFFFYYYIIDDVIIYNLSGHLEIGVVTYLICSFLSFILVMIYGTEAYLNSRKKARKERLRTSITTKPG